VLGRLQLGQAVTLHCDGCPAPINAKVSFIAREAEFTAPLIYSKENRAKLVFMVEALPVSADDAKRLHPGQPLDVRL
jgi:HlyD family secretion protein